MGYQVIYQKLIENEHLRKTAPTYLIGIFIIAAVFVYKYVMRNADYWKKRNITSLRPQFFVGNLWKSFASKSALGPLLQEFYNSSDEPIVGFFTFDEPALLIRDLDLIKHVLIKDFKHFAGRALHLPNHKEILRHVLFFQEKAEWKTSRAKLTPAFSPGKMKNYVGMLVNICEEMVKFIKTSRKEHATKDMFLRYSTEVTSQILFGSRGDCFTHEDSVLHKQAKALLSSSLRNSQFFKTRLSSLFEVELFQKEIENFFRDVFMKILDSSNEMTGKTVIGLLNDLRNSDPSYDGDRILGQGLMVFFASAETSSITISYTLYELAMNPAIQDKARAEIFDIISKKGLTFEAIQDMKFLEMCISETLRKYPPLSFIDRKCTEDYHLPGTDLVLEKGLPVYIPVLGIQRDEKYFPEPEKYIPERFQDSEIGEGIVYVPFGIGPRRCLGEKFGLLSTKLAVLSILRNFSVEKSDRTPDVIEFDPKSVGLLPKCGLPLRFEELSVSK